MPPGGESEVEFVQSLERGLAVLRAFDGSRPTMTLADASAATGLSRATVRRILHTFKALGYVASDGRRFELTPKVLDLGYAYVSSLQLPDIAEPFMESLSAKVHESVSAAVLDGDEIVYVARVNTQRIMTISLSIGSRLPTLWTSMGRVLLTQFDDAVLCARIAEAEMTPLTNRSIIDRDRLLAEIATIRQQGFALVDQELEEGVRSVASALVDRHGRVVAAMNVSTHAGRVTLKELRSDILPELLATTADINRQLTKR